MDIRGGVLHRAIDNVVDELYDRTVPGDLLQISQLGDLPLDDAEISFIDVFIDVVDDKDVRGRQV